MAFRDDDVFRAIWQGQKPPTLQMNTDQLRERARQFETQIRRRNLRDQICFALVALGFAFCTVIGMNPVVRIGAAMIVIWAIYSMYALRRFGSPLNPSDASEQTCIAYHRMQLERQRDIALSWPWGVGLAMPGMALFIIGLPLYSAHPQWPISIVIGGIFVFMYVAIVIHGKRLAREWQREIDLL